MKSDRSFWGQAVLMLVCVFVMMLPLSCEDTNYDEEGDWDELAIAKTKSGCEDKCSPSCQCNWTETGCETDDDCSSGLRCEIRPQLGNRCLKAKDGGSTSDNTTTTDKNCHEFKPGHGSYCSDSCKCKEGEGDCDKDSQCMSGLVCKQQAGTDFCQKPSSDDNDDDDDDDGGGVASGSSNTLLVHDGDWKYVYCSGSAVKVSSSSSKKQRWVKRGVRNIYNESVNKYLYCPERDGGYAPTDCECSGRVENYHTKTSKTGGTAPATVPLNRDMYIAPNNNMNACLKVIRGDQIHSPCAIEPWRNQTCRKDNGDSFSSSEHAEPCDKFRLNN